MEYSVGDKVIHRAYGLGEITAFDEKRLAGKTRSYYVVEFGDLTIWVPIDDNNTQSIHLPIPSSEFHSLLDILNDPAEELPDDRKQRQILLSQRMKNWTCEEICAVIRDLMSLSRSQKLNRNDFEVLKRAEEYLLNEWELSLGTKRLVAQQQLQGILGVMPEN
jgi:RNA polymerase-interacting CarD/CdnL/TRCF family regulator